MKIIESKVYWPSMALKRYSFCIAKVMKRHGEAISLRENGLLWWDAFYINNLPHGRTRDFDEDGTLVRQRIFHSGSEIKHFPFLERKPKSKRPRYQRFEF